MSGAEAEDDDGAASLQPAFDGDGIGAVGGLITVFSPMESAFDMPLTVEVWDGEPDDDLADWAEAFEAPLTLDAKGLGWASPTVEYVNFALPPGVYRVRIAGRGFAPYGQDEIAPADEWRLQFWPAASPVPPRRLRSWAGPRSV